MTMPELALRFILANDDVATVIPGMRKLAHVDANISASDGVRLAPAIVSQLQRHRWER
jgi:aryl-alcohol dehydrogenase-like predicted oxidoreductase